MVVKYKKFGGVIL